MKKIELLAPAGNMESLKAAVAAGCNAVYLGMTTFSARAFAGNFTREELIEAVEYCHIRDVRIYVTMNTMLYETEIENAKDTVRFLYENNIDGLLIQDFGLFHLVRTMYPDFDVHTSTQMHVHNLSGVNFMKSQGVKRVVLARETPIEIIREACKTGVDIEIFAYGAICISYSGQCLMSASRKNRSANRGMCAQCCRLKYFPSEAGHFEEGDYILSPRDLNVIENIPELIEAGVTSLKIEGRMKRPEYVFKVVSTFRKVIDSYYENKKASITKKDDEELRLLFNRGFSQGHIFHDTVEHRMSQYRPNHMGITVGKVLNATKDRVTVSLSQPVHQRDGLRILNDHLDIGLTAVKIWKNEKLVSEAYAGDVIQLTYKADHRPKKGDMLQKTTDVVLMDELHKQLEQSEYRSPVSISYKALINRPLQIEICDNRGNHVMTQSEQLIQEAKKSPVTKERLQESLCKLGDYPYYVEEIHGEIENIFLPVSVINEVRRNAMDELNRRRVIWNVRNGEQEYHLELKEPEYDDSMSYLLVEDHIGCSNHIEQASVYERGDHLLPAINESQNGFMKYEHCILSQVGDLNSERIHCIAGMTLNIANSYSIAYLLSLGGIDGFIFSSECNEFQIESTLKAFYNRYGFHPRAYRLTYGRRTLMSIKDNFLPHQVKMIEDLHGEEYPIVQNDKYVEIIEPEIYHQKNTYCFGSYVILNDENINVQKIEEEAYEEVSRRI